MKSLTMKRSDTLTKNRNARPFEVTQAVVGIEFGPSDAPLINYLDFFAKKIPMSAVFFVHVMPRIQLFDIEGMMDLEVPFEQDLDVRDEVIFKMEQEIRKRFHGNERMYIEFDVRIGDPLEEILTDTKELKSDLVVIGQKTKNGWHGIMARNLARKITGNALVVPDRAVPALNQILVPIDFSPNSIRALETAVNLRKRLGPGCKVNCVHIYEMPNFSYYQLNRSAEQLRQIIESNIHESFEALLSRFPLEERKFLSTTLICKELPGIGGYIMEAAEKAHADLIVMGAKGHSKVELLLLGSVTEKVLDLNKHIPTLIIK